MKKIILVTLLLLAKFSISQNLVNNSSFEQLSSCNNLGGGGLDSAIGWWDINSADAFNTCSVTSGVPSNSYGYQFPFDGNGYAFFASYLGPPSFDYREYAQTQLSDSLQPGVKYYVSFQISFADNFQFASDGIGAFLSMDTVYGVGPGIIDSIPQVEVPAGIPVTDSINWVRVSGAFIAQGGERYLTIGNFKHDAQLTLQDLGGSANSGGYYLDAVCVSPDSLTCYNFVGVNEIKMVNPIHVYPNPAFDRVFIESGLVIEKNELIDLSGRLVKTVNKPSCSIDVSSLTKGIYFLKVYTLSGCFTKKIVKE